MFFCKIFFITNYSKNTGVTKSVHGDTHRDIDVIVYKCIISNICISWI